MGVMALRQYPGFKWEPRRIGLDHHEAVSFGHQAYARLRFLAHNVAVGAALLKVVVLLGTVQLFFHSLRNDGQSDQLRMGMLERGTRGFSMILEKQNVAQPPVLLE